MKYPTLATGQLRCDDCSTMRLMEASALSSDRRVLSTTTFRSIEPLTPVNPISVLSSETEPTRRNRDADEHEHDRGDDALMKTPMGLDGVEHQHGETDRCDRHEHGRVLLKHRDSRFGRRSNNPF